MDVRVIEGMRAAGIDPTLKFLPQLAIPLDDAGRPKCHGEEVAFSGGPAGVAFVHIDPLSKLFAGMGEAPMAVNPDPNSPYLLMFWMLEMAALQYCRSCGLDETDQEFERLYRQLRRRPDGTDNTPLFSHIQAAARVYVALTDTSQAEFEAVVQRLSRSARTFSRNPVSRNYLAQLRKQFGP